MALPRKWTLLASLAAAGAVLESCGGNDYYTPCGDCYGPSVQVRITVSGLASGTSVVLDDTNGVATTLSSNGTASYFAPMGSFWQPFLVGILEQPAGQLCSISNAQDAAGNDDVTVGCTLQLVSQSMLDLLAGGLTAGSADGPGASASFSGPSALAADPAGNLYVADTGNNTIRKVTAGGEVTTLAGAAGFSGGSDGTGAAARFRGPNGVATDSAGNVYVADTFNNTIRMVTPNGVVTTIAGTAGVFGAANGAAAAATFNQPLDVAIDGTGNIFVADNGNSLIREISASGTVSTLAGTAGANVFSAGMLPGSLQNPSSLVVANGNLYVTTLNAVAAVSSVP